MTPWVCLTTGMSRAIRALPTAVAVTSDAQQDVTNLIARCDDALADRLVAVNLFMDTGKPQLPAGAGTEARGCGQ